MEAEFTSKKKTNLKLVQGKGADVFTIDLFLTKKNVVRLEDNERTRIASCDGGVCRLTWKPQRPVA